MFTFGGTSVSTDAFVFYLREYGVWLAAAVLFSLPVVPVLKRRLSGKCWAEAVSWALLLVSFLVSVSFIVIGAYDPFIYFNF